MYLIANLFFFAVDAYIFVIIAQVALSWLVAFDIVNMSNEAAKNLSQLLHKLTDPVYKRLRKYIPPISGIDFSPLILILALQIGSHIIGRLLLPAPYMWM